MDYGDALLLLHFRKRKVSRIVSRFLSAETDEEVREHDETGNRG